MSGHTPDPGETAAFLLGVAEAGGGVGMTYDGDANSPRSVAYDLGRTIGEMPPGPWRSMLSAAPDLLAALSALCEYVARQEWGAAWAGRPHALMDAASAAIARAEGGAS